MGKHLLSSSMNSTVQFQDNHPGCMWGILHILDYHHWHHNIRNVFPLKKKHYRGRHARYKRKNLLHRVAEAEPLLVWQHGKSSPKSSNEESHTENMSKGENSRGWIIEFHGESKHLESSHNSVRSKGCNTMKDGKMTEASLEQKVSEAKKLSRDTPIKSKRHGDVLEVLGVEKDLLLKFLLDIDVCEENLQPAFNNKARLTKLGSVPQPSPMRSISPIILEHKQNEIWPFHKGGKLHGGAQAQKMFASSFGNISYVKPMALEGAMKLKHKQSFSSCSRNPQGLNHKGWNQLVVHRFKVIKQKIKHAIIDFKKSGYQTSVEAVHHRASSEYSVGNNEGEISQSLEWGANQEFKENRSSDETKASDYDSSIHGVCSMKRASSLNESLDRYMQLFEQSFNKDVKWHSSMSKSLKLANGDNNNKSVCPPKASRRNLSLPNLDSFGLFILNEALSDANNVGMTVEETEYIHVQRNSTSLPLNISLDYIAEAEIEETVDSSKDVKPSLLSEDINEGMNCDQREDTHEPALEDGSFPQEQVEEISSCENNKTNHAEDRESNARGSSMDELESELPNEGSAYSWPGSLHNTNTTAKGTQTKSDTEIDSNFKYVKNVVEFLGFKVDEDNIQMRHTVDLDESWGNEIEFFAEEEESETLNTDHHHQLLLCNVVKEVLLQIHETSPNYFPRPFSFNRCLSYKGNHIVDEVWTRVEAYLSLRPELDQTLDDVIGRDLAKISSGWMNLQHEEECVALELEDMIVKDLLDQVIFT